MKRYVLKINDSTYVSDINWIIGEIPEIKTSKFEDAKLVTDEYLNYPVKKNGGGEDVSAKEVLLQYYPHLQIKKVKIIEEE